MKLIALGSDHGGYALKETIKQHLEKQGIAFRDFGAYDDASCSWSKMAEDPCRAVLRGECRLALLFCGTGIGISIAANKIPGIRAAVCSDGFSAKYTRLHNDANVLCLGGRVVGPGLACELVDLFLDTQFEGGRHSERVDYLTELERRAAQQD